MTPSSTLPDNVQLRSLTPHCDHRGLFAELFRNEWEVGIQPVQWNFARSLPGTLRGVHVHPTHDDYLIILEGNASIGLKDLRPNSPSYGLATVVFLSGENLQALTIPHGVAHGFYYPTHATHLYAVSHYWNEHDELGCQWNDPGLAIPWKIDAGPLLSKKDQSLPSFKGLLEQLCCNC